MFFLFVCFLNEIGKKELGERKKKKKKEKTKQNKTKKKGKRKGLTAVPSLRERSASCPRSAGWACTLGITGG